MKDFRIWNTWYAIWVHSKLQVIGVLERAPPTASGKLILRHRVDSVDAVLRSRIAVVRRKSLHADFAILDAEKYHAQRAGKGSSIICRGWRVQRRRKINLPQRVMCARHSELLSKRAHRTQRNIGKARSAGPWSRLRTVSRLRSMYVLHNMERRDLISISVVLLLDSDEHDAVGGHYCLRGCSYVSARRKLMATSFEVRDCE